MLSTLEKVNYVLSVGSVDGVCTAAAVLRSAAPDAGVQFTQAFTVDKIDPYAWDEARTVLFVDLAVNNRDESMTQDFLRRVNEAGHEIVGVLDEHNADDWERAFASVGLSLDDLAIKPGSQETGDIKSSGALLLNLLGDEADEHSRELCEAADAADRTDFTTHFGGLVNQAVKSDIRDDSRRVYLAKHFANKHEPDLVILEWIGEYKRILANHDEIVAAKMDLGDGFVRVVGSGKQVDMSTLMPRLHREGAHIVAFQGEAFVPAEGGKRELLSLGTSDQSLNLKEIVEQAGVKPLGGFGSKVNVDLEDEEAAIEAIKTSMYGPKCPYCGQRRCAHAAGVAPMCEPLQAGDWED